MTGPTVAILATFMGICKVKDDNIVQAMQQAQADKLDHWNFYQARNIREEIAKATVTELALAAATAPLVLQDKYREALATYQKLAADQAQKKEDLRKQAEQDQRTYDALNFTRFWSGTSTLQLNSCCGESTHTISSTSGLGGTPTLSDYSASRYSTTP